MEISNPLISKLSRMELIMFTEKSFETSKYVFIRFGGESKYQVDQNPNVLFQQLWNRHGRKAAEQRLMDFYNWSVEDKD